MKNDRADMQAALDRAASKRIARMTRCEAGVALQGAMRRLIRAQDAVALPLSDRDRVRLLDMQAEIDLLSDRASVPVS